MKFLLSLALSSFALAAGAAAIPQDAYVVYDRGSLNPEMHVYGWWNAGINFTAANPDGEGQVFEFKASDGGAAASMGLNMETPQNTGILNSATLNFSWYATTPATYSVRLTSVAEQDYKFTVTADQTGKWNTTSLSVPQTFPTVAKEWKENTNLGIGYVFSIILDGGNAETAIYFDQIYYTGVDNSWKAPATEIPMPATAAPTPKQEAANVKSFFSSYGNNVGFGVGGWGQSTVQSTQNIDGQDVIMLRNFNYLGWDNFNIDISGYDYMHVDYWTPNEGTPFGFVPISLNPTVDTPIWNAPQVKAGEWNSYDAPLSYFSADKRKIEQIKFVANQNEGTTPYGYLANVYFWKEDKGTVDPEPGPGTDPTGAKYYLSGPIFADGSDSMEMTLDEASNTVSAVANVWPQTFNITRVADGETTVTYGAATDADAANQITRYGDFQGAANSGIDWVLSAVVCETSGSELGFIFNLDSLTLSISNDTGVRSIESAEGEAVYYNLQGVRVNNPERGIFIRVEGGNAVKVVR